MRGQRGFTLIEVMVAVLVLSIATVAALRGLGHADRSAAGANARVLADTVALNRAAEIRLAGDGNWRSLPARVTQGPHDWFIETVEAATAGGLVKVTLNVRAEGQPGAQFVLFAPAAKKP